MVENTIVIIILLKVSISLKCKDLINIYFIFFLYNIVWIFQSSIKGLSYLHLVQVHWTDTVNTKNYKQNFDYYPLIVNITIWGIYVLKFSSKPKYYVFCYKKFILISNYSLRYYFHLWVSAWWNIPLLFIIVNIFVFWVHRYQFSLFIQIFNSSIILFLLVMDKEKTQILNNSIFILCYGNLGFISSLLPFYLDIITLKNIMFTLSF